MKRHSHMYQATTKKSAINQPTNTHHRIKQEEKTRFFNVSPPTQVHTTCADNPQVRVTCGNAEDVACVASLSYYSHLSLEVFLNVVIQSPPGGDKHCLHYMHGFIQSAHHHFPLVVIRIGQQVIGLLHHAVHTIQH